MIDYQGSVIIACPPETVFGFITNMDNVKQWRLETDEYEIPKPGPIEQGSSWREHTYYLGRRRTGEVEVTDYVPGTQFTTRTIAENVPFMATYKVESVPEGTLFSMHVQGELTAMMRLIEPLIRKQIADSLASNFRHLKRVLEGEGAP